LAQAGLEFLLERARLEKFTSCTRAQCHPDTAYGTARL
jgi:hypothetical protein